MGACLLQSKVGVPQRGRCDGSEQVSDCRLPGHPAPAYDERPQVRFQSQDFLIAGTTSSGTPCVHCQCFIAYNGSDDHQRAVLNVQVRVPSSHVHRTRSADGGTQTEAGDDVIVDVMTSHFRWGSSTFSFSSVCVELPYYCFMCASVLLPEHTHHTQSK